MKTFILQKASTAQELVRVAQNSTDPVLVREADDECLVVMTPAVFERILFENDMLNARNRQLLHL